ncbi:MAG: methyltransferase domain-containing protein [Bacteroidetes bacterium]|nr:MAG: methyltransferase domain-containing protein [Bacteroidota bacterium]
MRQPLPPLPEKYRLERLRLDIGRRRVLLDQVANQEELLDELIAKGENHPDVLDDRLPYWADLWHSALALSRFLVQEGEVVRGEAVVELGCGLGLPGIVAGLEGGAVCFTDYLPEALALARHNWALNCTGPARFQLLDWRSPPADLKADLVLAADVAYEKRFFQPLLELFGTLLRPGGRILLAEPGRGIARPFLDELERRFRLNKSLLEQRWNDTTLAVGIYRLQMPAPGTPRLENSDNPRNESPS